MESSLPPSWDVWEGKVPACFAVFSYAVWEKEMEEGKNVRVTGEEDDGRKKKAKEH